MRYEVILYEAGANDKRARGAADVPRRTAARLTRSRAPRLHGGGVKRRIFRSFYESGAKRAKPPKRAGLFLKSRRARRFRADAAAHGRARETAAAAQNQLKPKKSFFPGCAPPSALDK